MLQIANITQQLKKIWAPKSTRELGQFAESWAQSYLQMQGLTFVDRNYHCAFGEIDLIMQHKTTCIFVEVRARRHQPHENIMLSIDEIKQARWQRSAVVFLQQHGHKVPRDYRFDIITLAINDHSLQLEWSKDVLFNSDLGESSPWIF